jgi:hypothetical protein
MAESQTVTLTAHLTHDQATALAQFVKRVGVTDLRPFAVDIDEAYLMRDGCDAVAAALADSGYRPR